MQMDFSPLYFEEIQKCFDTFDVSNSKTKIAGLVRNFDTEGMWGRKESRKMDKFCPFALVAEEALENSGLELDKIDLELLGAKGASLSPVTACSIGNTAIGEAFRAIRSSEADVILTGGTEAAVTNISLASFGNTTSYLPTMRNPF